MPPAGSNTQRLTAVAEVGGALKQVQQAFSAYQVARNNFVNSLSGFLESKDPNNVTLEALMKNDVMAVLCCPLAQDPVAGIQSLSLNCLGKLSAADPLLSEVVVSCGVLDSIIVSLAHESPTVQASANDVLASVASTSNEFAHRVLTAGVMPHVLRQLQSGPPPVKEAAIRTLNALINSSPEHAAAVCDDTLLQLLVALLSVPGSPHTLTRALVICLSHVAAGGQALAEALLRHKVLDPFTAMVRGANTPPDIKAAALNALAQVCRHHEELANQVANQGVLSAAVQLLTDKMNPSIRRNAAALLLQAVQKTPDLAEVVSKAGAPACLVKYMALEAGGKDGLLAGAMIAGCMSSYKAGVAKAVVDAGVGAPLIECTRHADPGVAGVAAWALEQQAQHMAECAGPLIEAGALAALVELYQRANPVSQPDLFRKAKSAVKAVIRSAATAQSLEAFVVPTLPPPLLKHLLRKLEVLLAKSPKGRQSFVTSGALQRLQAHAPPGELDPVCEELREAINSLFPEDVVKYYSN